MFDDYAYAKALRDPYTKYFLRKLFVYSPETYNHSLSVAFYAVQLMDKVEIHGADRRAVIQGALLHDIGKMAVPLEILHKPDILTKEEFEIIKTHVTAWREVTEGFYPEQTVKEICTLHHEKLDGSGYLGLTNIPEYVQIITVADIYNAMQTERAYKKASPRNKSILELYKLADEKKIQERYVDALRGLSELEEEKEYIEAKGRIV